MIGIYKITNVLNQQCYIGQSVDIEARWSKHLSTYRLKSAPDYKIYRAMNKYGIENFTFEVIELCDSSLLNEREMYWIKHFDSFNNGYNMTLGGSACLGINDKIVYQYDLQGNFIQEYSSAHEASRDTGISYSNICKVCRGERHTAGNFGWSYNKVNKLPIKLMVPHSTPVIQYDKNGNYIKEYSCAKEAYKITGISDTTIGNVCKGKGKTAGGYVWKYKNEIMD